MQLCFLSWQELQTMHSGDGAAIRVLNTLPLGADNIARLQAVSPRIEVVEQRLTPPEWEQLHDERLEVIIGSRLPGQPELTPSLRWLQSPSGGAEYLQVPAAGLQAWPHGVTITNGRGTYSIAVGEYILWAIMDHYQRGANRRLQQSQRLWPPLEDEEPAVGRRLRNQTVLLVGYGSVGRQVGHLVDQLGMRVLAVKADPGTLASEDFALPGCGDPAGSIPVQVGGVDELPAFAAQADVVVVTLPATAATRNVVDQEVIRALGAHALVVVAGRGVTVDYPALLDAVAHGRIAGATIDTFPDEPLGADDPAWTIPGVVVTPHVAGGVAGDPIFHDLPLFMELLLENLHRYVAGTALANRMDVDRGY
jgi:phosphoglycerate dehydrogenase-like enzyme